MIPKRLGPYDVVRKLGAGGMGCVYEGLHRETGERVAVKTLAAQFASDPEIVNRFAAEIETLTKCAHPKIVRIYGYGEYDGNHFYAMELMEGVSLEEHLKKVKRFSWQEACRIAIELCVALKYAHIRGIIHRDLKPANVIMERNGHLKLVDFGIARVYGADSMTMEGSLIGTPSYLSPEQASGAARVSEQSDLYSLGCVLYALMTGSPPFKKPTAVGVIQAHLNENPIPLRERVEVPAELDELVMRLLAKDPAERLRTAHAVSHSLSTIIAQAAAVAEGTSVSAPTKPEEEPQPNETLDSGPSLQETAVHESGVGDTDTPIGVRPGAVTAASVPGGTAGSYTKVDVNDSDSAGDAQNGPAFSALQILKGTLLAALILVFASIAYFATHYRLQDSRVRNDTNSRYRRIKRTKLDRLSLPGLQRLLSDTDSFIGSLPNDNRSSDLRRHRKQIEYYIYKTKLPRKSSALTETEKACQQAMRLKETDLYAARLRFDEIAESIGSEARSSGPVTRQRCRRIASEESRKIESELRSAYAQAQTTFKGSKTKKDYEKSLEQIGQFIASCPSDPRASSMKELRSTVEFCIYRIELTSEGKLSDRQLTSDESRFVKSVSLKKIHPGRALKHLRDLALKTKDAKCKAASQYEADKIDRDLASRFADYEKLRDKGVATLNKDREKLLYLVDHFAHDPRCARVADSLLQVDIYRLPSVLAKRIKENGERSLEPIHRAYYRADRAGKADLLAGAKMFESLVELYDTGGKPSRDRRICLEAAKLQAQRLIQMADSAYGALRIDLTKRLADADKLAKTNPSKASKKYQAIINLHGDELWAEDLVKQARARLR